MLDGQQHLPAHWTNVVDQIGILRILLTITVSFYYFVVEDFDLLPLEVFNLQSVLVRLFLHFLNFQNNLQQSVVVKVVLGVV